MTSRVLGSKFPTKDNVQIGFRIPPCEPHKGLSFYSKSKPRPPPDFRSWLSGPTARASLSQWDRESFSFSKGGSYSGKEESLTQIKCDYWKSFQDPSSLSLSTCFNLPESILTHSQDRYLCENHYRDHRSVQRVNGHNIFKFWILCKSPKSISKVTVLYNNH